MFRTLHPPLTALLLVAAAGNGQAADPASDFAFTAHAAAVAGVETLQCRVRVETLRRPDGVTGTAEGRYSRAAGRERIEMVWPDRSYTAVLEPERLLSLTSQKQSGRSSHMGHVSKPSMRSDNWFDVWSATLFGFFGERGENTRPLSSRFDGLSTSLRRSPDGLVVIEGRSVQPASVGQPSVQVKVMLDPRKNHLLTEFDASYVLLLPGQPQSTRRHWRTAGGFKEVAGGRYVPTVTTHKRFVNDQIIQDERATLRDIRVNEPIADKAFDLTFPSGTEVVNKLTGVEYIAAADGNPAAPPTTYVAGRALGGDAKLPPPGAVSVSEPRATGWWLLPASVGLLVSLVGFWFVRRWRAVT